jgi:hypothetical protein
VNAVVYLDSESEGWLVQNNFYRNLTPRNDNNYDVSGGGVANVVAPFYTNSDRALNTITDPQPDTVQGAAGIIALAGLQSHWSALRS